MKVKLYELIEDNHPRFLVEYEDESIPLPGTFLDVFSSEGDKAFQVQFERMTLNQTKEKTAVSQHAVFVKRIS